MLGISKDLAYDLAGSAASYRARSLGRRWVVSRPHLLAALGAEDGAPEKAG